VCSVGQQNRVYQITRSSTDDLRAREEVCNITSSSQRRCTCVRTAAKHVCCRVGTNSFEALQNYTPKKQECAAAVSGAVTFAVKRQGCVLEVTQAGEDRIMQWYWGSCAFRRTTKESPIRRVYSYNI
jgi:hypothetical protein